MKYLLSTFYFFFLANTLIAQSECPIEIALTQPDLIRCEESTFIATIKNKSEFDSDGFLLSIQIDKNLSFVSTTEPHFYDNQVLEFYFTSIKANSSIYIPVTVKLSCNTLLGASHPIKAFISPWCHLEWEGPEYEVNSSCEDDEVIFTIKNVGVNGSNIGTTYNLIADGILLEKETEIFLAGNGQEIKLSFPANGRTWQLDVKQKEGYPYARNASSVIEACGKGANGLYSIGFQDAFLLDDDVPNRSYISPINTSGVPNKISAVVQGDGTNRVIGSNEAIEYVLRAKNSLEEIGDFISIFINIHPNLDKNTFEVLASNKEVDFEILNETWINVTMENANIKPGEDIMLRYRIFPFEYEQNSARLDASGHVKINQKIEIELLPTRLEYLKEEFWQASSIDIPSSNFQSYGGRYLNLSRTLAQAEDHSIFIGGNSKSYSDNAYNSGLLIKTDELGIVKWLNVIDFEKSFCNIKGIIPQSDGTCLVFGTTSNQISDNPIQVISKSYVAKIDEFGKTLWHQFYNPNLDNKNAFCTGATLLEDNKNLMFGYVADGDNRYAFERLLDNEGETIWERYEETEDKIIPNNAIITKDKDIVIMGTFNSAFGNSSYYIEKINAEGDTKWISYFQENTSTYLKDLVETKDNDILIVGAQSWTAQGLNNEQPFLVSFDENGKYLEEKRLELEGIRESKGNGIYAKEDGTFYIGGDLKDSSLWGRSMVLMDLDENKNLTNWNEYDNDQQNHMADFLVGNNNKIYFLANDNSTGNNRWMIDLLVLDENGNNLVNVNQVEDVFYTVSISPNPSNNQTNISFTSIPKNPLTWNLIDINGKTIKKGITNEKQFNLNTSNISSGMYYLNFDHQNYKGKRLIIAH